MRIVCLLFFFGLSFSAFSQRGDDELNQVAAAACDCIANLDLNLATAQKNDSIQSCINTYNFVSLIKQTMMPVGKDSIKNVIVANQDYDEIQQLLRDNCPAMKRLLQADNKKSEFSHSGNEKARAFYKKGDAFFEDKKYEKAIQEYKKAVKADPNFAFAWDNLGMSYRMLDKFKEAIECYKRSLAIDPSGTVPLQSIAVAQELLKDYKSAAETYEQFIKRNPENPEGFYGASRMYYNLNNYEPAVDNMCRAYLLYKTLNSPYVADAESNLSLFYKTLKEKGQLELFTATAKKYNINITE